MIASHSPNLTETSDRRALDTLRADTHGELVLPGDTAYEAVRRIFNWDIDRHPALIVRCADANDVVCAVEFGKQSNLEIAVRGGGHNLPGFAISEGGLVVDLSPMKAVSVHPHGRTARVGAGVKLGELIQATEAYGLATNTGTASDTGIAGLTLGGGEGWLMGKYGLTCDNVRSFEVVTADGRLLRADASENPDLYWGLRGGGGNFGIVTTFEYQLYPVDRILGGMVAHPLSRAREVLEFYSEFVEAAPDELTTLCVMKSAPDGNRVIAIAACYCGDLAEGERVLAPLRKFGPPIADLIQPMPYSGLFALVDEAFREGRSLYMKGTGVNALSDEAIDALVDSAEGMTSPLAQIFVMPVRGAASRVGVSDTAFAYREEHYEILHIAVWEDDGRERHVQWARESWQMLQRFASQRGYVNFIDDEGTARVRAAYGPNYERLVALKTKYDPDNVFHLNQNIKPNIMPDAG
jgi:FAD/FMN-containing dehydrogenase